MKQQKEYVLTIIPTYNRSKLLIESIESVLLQDYPYKKILIVDDGSTNGTRGACDQYVKEYPGNIFYEYKQHGGCASARNYGLNWMDEDIGYVCFLDDDDRLLSGKFNREVRLLSENPEADFSYADSIIFDEETKCEKRAKVAAAGEPEHFAIEHFLTNEAKSAAILYGVHVVKHRRFREELKYNEDSEFLQRVAIECRGVYSPEPSCWVRWHAGSKSRSLIEIHKGILQSSLGIMNSYFSFYHVYKDLIDQRIKKIENDLFIELLLVGRADEAKAYMTNRLKKYFACQLGFYYRMKASSMTLMGFNK